jgi:L-2,4-diaminobutyrate decarboxylase
MMYDLAQNCAEIVRRSPDFELGADPQSNIITFRYTNRDSMDIDALQIQIRKRILAKGSFYIVQTQLKNKTYLRCTLINPLTTEQTFRDLLGEIKDIASSLQ